MHIKLYYKNCYKATEIFKNENLYIEKKFCVGDIIDKYPLFFVVTGSQRFIIVPRYPWIILNTPAFKPNFNAAYRRFITRQLFMAKKLPAVHFFDYPKDWVSQLRKTPFYAQTHSSQHINTTQTN